MVKSAVKVVLRARPSANFASSNISISDDDQTLQLFLSKQEGASKNLQEHYQFKFAHLLHNASQEVAYEVCAKEIVGSVVQGYNGTVMAYGQTGAGKTYTMFGKGSTFQHRGITPRAITEIFQRLGQESRSLVTVRVSYIEIYNETFYDLLRPSTDPSHISVSEDSKGGIHVKGVECRPVGGEADALGALFEGETGRAIAQHQMNKHSSRSHAIFTLYLESRSHPESEEIMVSKLHLVDLAGSERVLKTGSTGKVLKEATHINRSLTFLEQVIVALSERNRDHVPYRSSKLTHVLKDSLGGNCKTLMIANVWGELEQLEETLSTCRFAQRMSRVTSEVSLNTKQDPLQLIKKYEREIADLKQELSMHDQFAAQSAKTYSAYSEAQREKLRSQVIAYFASDEPEYSIAPLELTSLRHVKEVLVQCKSLFNERGRFNAAAPPTAAASPLTQPDGRILPSSATSTTAALAADAIVAPKHISDEEAGYVGELEDDRATRGIPAAPDELQDAFVAGLHHPPSSHARSATMSPAHTAAPVTTDAPVRALRTPPSNSEEAFEEFKSSAGSELSLALMENKRSLRAAKQKQKDVAVQINSVKKDIDVLKERVENTRVEDGAELDAEEYEALLQLKALKAQYRDRYGELQMVKSEVEYTSRLVQSCTDELTAAFKAWYTEQFATPSSGKTTSASTIGNNQQPSAAAPSVAAAAAQPAKQSAAPVRPRSEAESAFYLAQQSRGSPPAKTDKSIGGSAARGRVHGTFGSAPKIGSQSKTNMDIDRGRNK